MKFRSFIFFTLLNFNILFSQYVEVSRLGVLDFEPRGVPISLTQSFTEAVRNELENSNLIIDSFEIKIKEINKNKFINEFKDEFSNKFTVFSVKSLYIMNYCMIHEFTECW